MFIVDPEDLEAIDPSALQLLFGFTPAEARLAARLAMGEALPKVASRLGISINTARTLLARASAKTQANSQLSLIQTILSSLPHRLR